MAAGDWGLEKLRHELQAVALAGTIQPAKPIAGPARQKNVGPRAGRSDVGRPVLIRVRTVMLGECDLHAVPDVLEGQECPNR